jgi:hypothetical protein
MPDSQVPPLWGPAYDERDLDALLSGETGSTPVALQPVESTLAALRAPATRRELADEAVARAGFRAFRAWAPAPLTPATEPWTAVSEPWTPATEPWTAVSEPWTDETEHAAVTAHTLVLPSADHRKQRAARHRHRRPAAKGGRRPGIAVTGAASAALIVVAAVVTGALTGSIGELTSFGRQPVSATASARATGQSPGSQGQLLVTGAATERPANPATTAPASPAPRPTSDPGSLCREYFAYLEHPTRGGGAAWIALGGQLSKLAGGPPKIYGYCVRTLDNQPGGKGPWPPPGPDTGGLGAGGGENPGTGSPGVGSQGNQGSGTSDQGASGDPGARVGGP